MNPIIPPDPWDHIPEPPEPKPDKFTKGEIAFWGCLFVAVVAGISYLAIRIVTAWLKLPLNP